MFGSASISFFRRRAVRDVLFARAASADGARVLAAVAGVDRDGGGRDSLRFAPVADAFAIPR